MRGLKPLLTVLIVVLLLTSAKGQAKRYQSSAQLPLQGRDPAAVREAVIQLAITNATYQSGGYFTTEQEVRDGQLRYNTMHLRSQGRIRHVQVLNETLIDDMLRVVVQVEIDPAPDCRRDHYAKPLLIAQMPLIAPQQAAHGALFDIGLQVSKRFEQKLRRQPRIIVSQLLDQALLPATPQQQFDAKRLADNSRFLARRHHSQFVLFGFIRDISLFEQVDTGLIFDDVDKLRNFTLQLYLYDAVRGILLLQQDYHGEASWGYAEHARVDMNNSVFWRSDYGQAILTTLDSAIADISNTLACQQSLARIIDKQDEYLVINRGARHGLAPGDSFAPLKQQHLAAPGTHPLHQLGSAHPGQLRVLQTDADTAILGSGDHSLLDATRLQDLVGSTSAADHADVHISSPLP